MAVLSANRDVDHMTSQELREYQVVAADIIYRGAFVGVDPAGYAKPFEPGDTFIGIAYEEVDNSTGAVGADKVRVYTEGDFNHAVTSAALIMTGMPVYATDDNTLALVGHPDAFVGRIVYKDADVSGYAIIRLRGLHDHLVPGVDKGFIEHTIDFSKIPTYLSTTTGTVQLTQTAFELESIDGAGLPRIAGTTALNEGIKFQYDAQAEVALSSIRTLYDHYPVNGGITFEATLHVEDHGDNAALDIDWGLGTTLTTNSEADIDHGDMVQLACFHMDGAADNIWAQSDDNTTDVASVDTTIVNIETDAAASFKTFKIVVRPAGTVEFWIDGVRALATTTFAVLSTAILGAFVNAEKTADNTLLELNLIHLRVAGAMKQEVA